MYWNFLFMQYKLEQKLFPTLFCFLFVLISMKELLGFKIPSAFIVKTMQGLDTVESLSAEASGNLSTNRNYLISIIVSGTNLVAVQPLYDILLTISTTVGLVLPNFQLPYKSFQHIFSITVGMTKSRAFGALILLKYFQYCTVGMTKNRAFAAKSC